MDSTGNAKRIAGALRSLHLNGYADDSFTKPAVHARLNREFYTDLLTPKAEGLSFAEASCGAQIATLFETRVRIASPEVLIHFAEQAMSAATAKVDQAVRDIECLQQHVA